MTEPVLKIAYVVDRFGSRFGGAEAYGVELMRQLSSNHEVTVFAREYDPACGIRLPFVPIRLAAGLPSWLRVWLFGMRVQRLTATGFDIVHSHVNGRCGDIEVIHVTPVRYNWRVKRLSWIKKVTSYISPRVQVYLRLEAGRVKARRGHRTVAVSGLIADQLRQAYGEQAFPVIAPGVAPAALPDPEQRRALRNKFGWADDDTVLLLVARNPQRKGLETVLKALEQLPDHIRLVVVGGNAATRDAVKRHQAISSARVQVIEATSNVAPYYGSADIYVHPTLNDSFGMAPLEAMSFGLPVILSPSPWCGFAQYVKHGTEAMVMSHPENADELARLIAALDHDTSLRTVLKSGGQDVVARHSWSHVADQYLELYRDVLAEKAVSR